MARPIILKYLVLSILFLLAAFCVQARGTGETRSKSLSLSEGLEHIPGWELVRQIEMDSRYVQGLDLDDYFFSSFRKGGQVVDLFVGFYHSAAKAGAPHSPLVCFSGQGWTISHPGSGRMECVGKSVQEIAFSDLTASRDTDKEYVLYWFQAYDQPMAGPFSQKLMLLKKKLFREGQSNAFVRVSTGMKDLTSEEARERVSGFVESFYPEFLAYVKSE
ncbi:MAG: EpsI family protein [Desulfuromonadales bacterium]|nr:EpsI family protein [Desulfuromonadales bacterium]